MNKRIRMVVLSILQIVSLMALSRTGMANEKDGKFRYYNIDETPIWFIKHKGYSVSVEPCEKNSACIARQIIENKVKKPNLKQVKLTDINPAALVCIAMEGSPFTVLDEDKSEISTCEFKDGSIMEGWDIINILTK